MQIRALPCINRPQQAHPYRSATAGESDGAMNRKDWRSALRCSRHFTSVITTAYCLPVPSLITSNSSKAKLIRMCVCQLSWIIEIMLRMIILGLGANAFGQALNIVIQLLSLQLYILYLDLPTYGTWIMLSALPSYLSMADFCMVYTQEIG